MTRLALYTEPYGSTGNIGENFLRLLGTPNSDALHTVIREAVQNVADAAKLGRGPDILIRIRRLDAAQMACLRSRVLFALPEEPHSRARLQQFLDQECPVVLEICDFNTTGLGGPTRADRIPVGTERTDFINFLRNIGTPRDTEHGGGTYGFGKAALYSVSRCRTIIVDTVVNSAGEQERRLIGSHVGSPFEKAEHGMLRQFTGRHWWGVADPSDGIVDPALDETADKIAEDLGLPDRGPDRTGTSIMMLDFDTEGEDLQAVGRRLIEGLLWSFWPRMMRDAPDAKRFTCRVLVNDDELEIPAPEDFPPLDLFCDAMRAARSGEGIYVRPIASQRPIKHLGNLAITKGLSGRRRHLVDEKSLFAPASHHIALMRPVELVVKYLKGSPFPDERYEWAGVFLVDSDEEVERAFAYSEPPAHDDWVPAHMEKGRARTFVRVALERLQGAAFEMGLTGSGKASGVSEGPPLARVAGKLGAALAGVTGDGAGLRKSSGGGGGSIARNARASRPVFQQLLRIDGRTLAIFSTEVRQDSGRLGRALKVSASVAMDGGAATNLDSSVPLPEVVQIRGSDGTMTAEGDLLTIDGAEGRFEISVVVPPDCAVTVSAEVLRGPEA